MRPLALTLRSFGPFTGEQSVDFTRYGDNAFLLIHGPTGAGKTTILDGICYALYGDASGEKRDERYLRSQQAKADTLCEVEFLFQVGPRRFHIRRTPPQQVHQKGKIREIKHQVEFCQVDETGTVIGDRLTKVGDVRQKVEEVLGFTSDQFRQVVVLPQGEFRKLLLAKSDEKEQILEKLFGTIRFKTVEQSLKNRRATLGGELKELKAAIEGIVSSNNAASVSELHDQLLQLGTQLDERAEQRTRQLELQQLAEQRLQEARSCAERFAERDAAHSSHDQLAARKPEMEQQAARVERAGRALHLVDLDEAIRKNAQELNNRTLELTALTETIATLLEQQGECSSQLAAARELAGRTPELIAEKTRLEEQLRTINELAAAHKRTQQADQTEKKARSALEKLKASLAGHEQQLADCTGAIEALSGAQGETGQLRLEAEGLARLIEVRQRVAGDSLLLEGLNTELQTALQAVEAAEKQLQELQGTHDDLQQRFLAGQASVLVRELVDGQPCPVCGSMDHPVPAQPQETVPTDKELAASRKQLTAADTAGRQARERLAGLQVRQSGLVAGIQALTQQLGDAADTELPELLVQQEQLGTRLAAAEAARLELERRQIERSKLQESIAQERLKLATDERAVQTLTTQLDGYRAVEATLAAAGGAGDAAAVSKAIGEIETAVASSQKKLLDAEQRLAEIGSRLATAQGQQAEKQQQLSRLGTEREEQQKSFSLRLTVEGFSSEQDWQAARLPRDEIETARTGIEQFNRMLAAAQERLARADGSCSGLTRPDLAAAQAAKTDADSVLGQLLKEIGQLEGSRTALQAALAAIGGKAARIELLEQYYAVAGRLADLAGGLNPKRMTLQRYVLAALFEEVALAASQRLSRMSRGRYHLVRSEAPRDGKSTSGLDLDVTDDHTGDKRPAFTLSGGESFLASLSLALGLSDVVMAQCGGRYLDCIFIDEGFGSLDGETLDYALNTLIELHRAGRVIGIISHVAELKERITSQIEVLPSKEGSTVVCSR